MILLFAVILGFAAGLIRARINQRKLKSVKLEKVWLVFAAYIPQLFAFSLYQTKTIIPDEYIPFILIGSQMLLLLFVWFNRNLPGIYVLGLGLLLNFVVIVLNQGFMPLSPETANKLIPEGVQVDLEIGKRVEFGKDILLLKEETRLWFLSDIFTLPKWTNLKIAFSIGDIFISIGALLLLWSLGGPSPHEKQEAQNA